jgi:prepilin-type N-terminal cleavage/methylation domain-containing protein
MTIHRKGFTLIEVLVSTACLLLVLGPIFAIFSSGSRQSHKGMLRIETSLESRRVLRQISRDLKSGVVLLGTRQNQLVGLNDLMIGGLTTANRCLPQVRYSFYAFPSKAPLADGTPEDVIENRDHRTAPSPRHLARIEYAVEPNGDKRKFYRLIRREYYKHQRFERILSTKVNFFAISLIEFKPSNHPDHSFLQVSLQLVDALHHKDLEQVQGRIDPDSPINQRNLVISDAFEIVYPEAFNAFLAFPQLNPSWHTAQQKIPFQTP